MKQPTFWQYVSLKLRHNDVASGTVLFTGMLGFHESPNLSIFFDNIYIFNWIMLSYNLVRVHLHQAKANVEANVFFIFTNASCECTTDGAQVI